MRSHRDLVLPQGLMYPSSGYLSCKQALTGRRVSLYLYAATDTQHIHSSVNVQISRQKNTYVYVCIYVYIHNGNIHAPINNSSKPLH